MLNVKHQNYDLYHYCFSQYLIHSSMILLLCYWVKFIYIEFRIFESIALSEIGL